MKNSEPKWPSLQGQEESKAPKDQMIIKEPSIVEVVQNHIYFYAEIGREEVLKLNKTLRDTAISLFNTAQTQNIEPANIYLHINSYGGSLFAGLAALDEIVNCQIPVHAIVDGCAASAATLLVVPAKKRIIRRHGFMLIHQLSYVFWGKYNEFVDEKKNLDRLMAMLKEVYREYTKMDMDKLGEILDHDLWFDAATCLEYGLVDEIQ